MFRNIRSVTISSWRPIYSMHLHCYPTEHHHLQDLQAQAGQQSNHHWTCCSPVRPTVACNDLISKIVNQICHHGSKFLKSMVLVQIQVSPSESPVAEPKVWVWHLDLQIWPLLLTKKSFKKSFRMFKKWISNTSPCFEVQVSRKNKEKNLLLSILWWLFNKDSYNGIVILPK